MAKQPDNSIEKPVAEHRPGHYSTVSIRHAWLYGAAAVVILILVFIAGVSAANRRNGIMTVKSVGFSGGGFGRRTIGAYGGPGGGLFGNSAGNNTQNRQSGVVTSVQGNSFTLASNGGTTNVTASSSTQYQGGSQVKVDDTVIVWGTTTNGTLSATQVAINP